MNTLIAKLPLSLRIEGDPARDVHCMLPAIQKASNKELLEEETQQANTFPRPAQAL